MFDETYSLRLVTEFLKSKEIPYKHSSARVGILFNEHGCQIKLNDTYTLSIQTHPDIAGSSFAETALQNMVTKQICYDGSYGYWDVERWDTPEQLFAHIMAIYGKDLWVDRPNIEKTDAE